MYLIENPMWHREDVIIFHISKFSHQNPHFDIAIHEQVHIEFYIYSTYFYSRF